MLRIRDVYPGSRIQLFSILDPGSELSPSRIRIKILSVLITKNGFYSKLYKICSGLFIPDTGSWCWLSTHPESRIHGSKRHRNPDPQHWFLEIYIIRCKFRFPDPNTETKEGGEKNFVAISFLGATNDTKQIIILLSKYWPIFKEFKKLLSKKNNH